MLKKIALVGVFAVVSFVSFGGASTASASSTKAATTVGAPIPQGIWCGCFKC